MNGNHGSPRRRRICLYVAGWPAPAIRDRFGTYVDWFARLIARHDVEVEVFDGTTAGAPGGRALPDRLDQLDAVVITGSPASLTSPEPWMDAAIELCRVTHRRRTPLLGVCFGHQLIGAAFGGAVVRNPAGWQLASRAITLSERGRRDPLFDSLPRSFTVNLSHQDIVARESLVAPSSVAAGDRIVEILAEDPRAAVAALAVGPVIRGVQFHPEFSGEVVRAYIAERRPILAEEAEARQAPGDHPDALLESVGDSPAGERVFHNFVSRVVP